MNAYRYRPHVGGGRLPYIERRHLRVQAWLDSLPQLQKETGQKHIIRLDPGSVFLIFYALFSFVAIIVLTNTPIIIGAVSTDLGNVAANYLLITAPVAAFAPLLVGSYLYDPRQLGPMLRPIIWRKRNVFPDVAIIGTLVGLLSIAAIDYTFTYGGFTPTLSFWNTVTNKIAYSDGGIFEEFIFRLVVYGAINRFPGVGNVLLGNPFAFLIFTAPLDSAAFVIYHLKVYASSTLSLNIVAGEAMVLNVGYRILKYALWVVMLIHGGANFAAAP